MSDDYVSIATFPKSFNVSALLIYLTENNIDYRLEEVASTQILLVAQAQARQVADFIQHLRSGEQPENDLNGEVDRFKVLLQLYPATIALIVLGFIGYLIARFDPDMSVIRWFTLVDYHFVGRTGVVPHSLFDSVVASHQYWRLLTPAFLHFGFLHILMNALGVWELGRRLELFLGSYRYLGIFAILVLFSNLIEYYFSGSALFGGLSGAVFGYVGVLAGLNRRVSAPILQLPKGLYVLVIAWAVMGLTGIVNKLFGIQLANGAHIGGLLVGFIVAMILPLQKKTKSSHEQLD